MLLANYELVCILLLDKNFACGQISVYKITAVTFNDNVKTLNKTDWISFIQGTPTNVNKKCSKGKIA